MVHAPPRTHWRDWLWPLLLAATLFYASAHGQVAGPDVIGIDKVAHFLVYGLLATLLARVPAIATAQPLGLWLAVVLASAYGITDELHQSFTPGRSVDVVDWLCDTTGALAAVSLYGRWEAYRGWVERPLAGNPRVESEAENRPY